MKLYEILITKRALKDLSFFSEKEKKKCKDVLLNILQENPYAGKKLKGDLAPNYSYRLSLKNRIVYEINKEKNIIYIKRLRTHYGN